MTTPTNGADHGSGLIEALHCARPDPELAAELAFFGRLTGSWDVVWSARNGDGTKLTARGELHFGWVLGGRAIQDIWIVPGRGQPGEGKPPNAFHGSTIRFYDQSIDAWRSTWIEPVNGRVRRFIGVEREGGLELLSTEDRPQFRWRFSEVTSNSFLWSAESSYDDGSTWQPDDTMHCTRVT